MIAFNGMELNCTTYDQYTELHRNRPHNHIEN